ncbi:hypothetical protein NE237_019735 [Protea cynaroides]|uniref:DEUBAD domain-containing protein n=1 Tax=Protea cynaroides TaxID=273540 RepID=A0A9Q0K2S9_9MAGN|nr:hypothetical protein NE237_019735 [Protea cynaroides]
MRYMLRFCDTLREPLKILQVSCMHEEERRFSSIGIRRHIEQYRARKRKNPESTQNVLEIDSHIALKLNEKQVNPIARPEQIGIAWRDLDPFIESAPHRYTPLADVLSLPQEIFELENLTRLLSYEVWETNLLETERNFLTKFLPQGTDREKVVPALLKGENFHFGNPFLKWGALLCSGNLHPDAVLHQEYCFKANKRAYYLELQDYHNDILENLLNLKEIWASSADPEKHIFQKTWRRKGFIRDHQGNSLTVSERPRVLANPKKEEKSQALHIRSGNGANYMSYFKISRKQHRLVQRMKQSGDGIQSKSLIHVLGDIKSFHVQPYKTFEEEERKKLHDFWLLLVNRDIPAAFLDWKERQLKQQQWRCSLEQEMVEKKKNSVEEGQEKDYCDSTVDRQRGNEETENEPSMDIQNYEDDAEPVPQSAHYRPLERIPSLNGHNDPMETHSEEGSQEILKPELAPLNLSEFLGNINPIKGAVLHEVEVSSSKDALPVVGTSDMHCHSNSLSQGYPSLSELSLRQPNPMEESATGLIDLESDMAERDAKDALQHGSSNFVGSALHSSNSGSFFGSYTNQDCNELLQPIFKGQGFLPSYSDEHKQAPNLQFLATNNGSLGTGHVSRHFQEQQQQQQRQLLEQREMREKELYMQQVIQKSMYSSGNRYSGLPFPPVRVQDWVIDPAHLSTPIQSHSAGEALLGQNWFQDEHRAHGGWSGMDVSSSPGQCMGNGSGADESLFSVLSQSNKVQSQTYSQMRLTEHYTPGRDFMGGGIMGSSDVFPQMAHQLNYLSNCEATTTAVQKVNNMPWMNRQHQSTGVQDSIGKSSFFEVVGSIDRILCTPLDLGCQYTNIVQGNVGKMKNNGECEAIKRGSTMTFLSP